jgi:hypothetical protein
VLELTAEYSYGTDLAINVFHLQKNAAITLADLNTVTTAFQNWESATGAHHRSSDAGLSGLIATDLTTQNGISQRYEIVPEINGGNGDGVDSFGITWCIKWTTAQRGRSFRGRTYYVGVPKADLVDNLIDATFAAAVIVDYQALRTALNAITGFTMVVLSRYHGVDANGKPVPRAAGLTTPVNNPSFTDLWADFQRRRAPGHSVHR